MLLNSSDAVHQRVGQGSTHVGGQRYLAGGEDIAVETLQQADIGIRLKVRFMRSACTSGGTGDGHIGLRPGQVSGVDTESPRFRVAAIGPWL